MNIFTALNTNVYVNNVNDSCYIKYDNYSFVQKWMHFHLVQIIFFMYKIFHNILFYTSYIKNKIRFNPNFYTT